LPTSEKIGEIGKKKKMLITDYHGVGISTMTFVDSCCSPVDFEEPVSILMSEQYLKAVI